MSRVIVIAEHDGAVLNPATARCVSCARSIPDAAIAVAICGSHTAELAREAATLEGVERVITLEHPALEHPLAAVLAPVLAATAQGASHVLGPSTTFGKDLMPRLAALLDAPQVSDIMAVESPTRFKRPIYAGNVIATVEVEGSPTLVGTVRTASYPEAPRGGSAAIEAASINASAAEGASHTQFVSLAAAKTDRPDLQSARRVVSGGRALGSAEGFELLYRLADKLGAAVGASRAAVDAGYVPNEMQVGQTGKIIAPELYIAIGISGAIQHLTGIKDARTIVAINKDAEAPIFEVADIGLVGDLFEIVPQLEQALS
ncbi:MAG: electron transfer flavoprotein subunit alpha/FixB family protein [Steroidobacteraceae bacterium]